MQSGSNLRPARGISRFTILHSHLDVFGHVNNVAFFRIFEDARWEWMQARGFDPLKEIRETGRGPIILEAAARFRREVKLGEPVRLETYWESFHKRFGKLKQVIYNADDEEVCVAELTMAFVNLVTRKIITPDERWREVFGVP